MNVPVQLSLPGRFLSVLIIKPHVFQNGKRLFFSDARIAHNAGVLVGKFPANGVFFAVFARIQCVVYNKFRSAAGNSSPQSRSADGGIHGVARLAVGGKNLSPLQRFRLADFTRLQRLRNRAISVLGRPLIVITAAGSKHQQKKKSSHCSNLHNSNVAKKEQNSEPCEMVNDEPKNDKPQK